MAPRTYVELKYDDRQMEETDLKQLKLRIAGVNHDIRTRGILYYEPADKELLTGYSYGEFYDWDLYFENIYMSCFGISTFCFENLREFLDLQYLNGFVPRTIGTNPGRLYQHVKPFLAQVAHLGSVQIRSYDWLKERRDRGYRKLLKNISLYEQLKLSLDYWFYYMDFDRNGLPVWMDSDQSGMDNQYSRLGVLREARVEGVDLASYLYRELRCMGVIAGQLGLEEDKDRFTAQAAVLKQKVNEIFWDEEEGFYFDRDEKSSSPVRVKTVAGFMPLWAGIASGEQAKRLIESHLLNPDEFWTRYPVASMARSETGYTPGSWEGYGCNWLGPAWVPVNYVLVHGLRRYGYPELAKELAGKTFEMVFARNPVTREYYHCENGSGLGLDPFWGWSALAYIMPLEQELGYDPTRIEGLSVRNPGKEILELEFPV